MSVINGCYSTTWFDKVKLEDCVIRDGVNVVFQSIRHLIIDKCTFSNISYLRSSDSSNPSPPPNAQYPIVSIGEFNLWTTRETVPRSIVMRNMQITDSNGTSIFTIYLPCVPDTTNPYKPCLEGSGIRQIIVENSTFYNNAPAYCASCANPASSESPILYLSKESGNVPVNFTINDCDFRANAFPPLTLLLSATPDIYVDMNIIDTMLYSFDFSGWLGLNVIREGNGGAIVRSNIEGCYQLSWDFLKLL